MLGEDLVRRGTVHADPEHLCAVIFELGDISLIRLELLRSTAGKGEHVERQHHVLLARKIAELHLLAVLVGQGKVRRFVAHVGRRCLRRHRGSEHERQNARPWSSPCASPCDGCAHKILLVGPGFLRRFRPELYPESAFARANLLIAEKQA